MNHSSHLKKWPLAMLSVVGGLFAVLYRDPAADQPDATVPGASWNVPRGTFRVVSVAVGMVFPLVAVVRRFLLGGFYGFVSGFF